MTEKKSPLIQWQPSLRRMPNALELYCMIFAAGALWYVPRALDRPADPGAPAFVGPVKGGTRAFGCLFQGDLIGAITYNPLAVALALVLLLGVARWLLIVLPLGKRPLVVLGPRGRWLALAAIVTGFAANWAYVIFAAPWR